LRKGPGDKLDSSVQLGRDAVHWTNEGARTTADHPHAQFAC
jgi:hypothetical protein